MSEYEQQRGTEAVGPELETAHHRGFAQRVGARAHHRQVAETAVEHDLGGHPGVDAGEHGGERGLTLGELLTTLDGQIRMGQPALDPPPIALQQQLKRLPGTVTTRSGIVEVLPPSAGIWDLSQLGREGAVTAGPFSKLGFALFGLLEIPEPRSGWLEIPAGHGVKGRREDGD